MLQKCSNNKFYVKDLRYYKFEIYIFFFKKFGFRIGTLNPNISFPYMLVHKNGPKWTQIGEMEQMDRMGIRWTK